jgi:hypothetical protein
MGMFDFLGGGGTGDATDPHWVKTAQGHYNRLAFIEPEELGLSGTGGVYVVWHAGVRSGWVYADKSNNLARALDDIMDNEDVMYYDNQGGLYVTWAMVREKHRDGVLRYLIDTMKPLVNTRRPPKKKVTPLPVLLPTDSK